MEPGSSMRKETDSRISARVAGFLGAVVRRDVAGGRMDPLSRVESGRERLLLRLAKGCCGGADGGGSAGCWDWESGSS